MAAASMSRGSGVTHSANRWKQAPDPIGLEILSLSEDIIVSVQEKLDVDLVDGKVVVDFDNINLVAAIGERKYYGTKLDTLVITLRGDGESDARIMLRNRKLPTHNFEGDPFVALFRDALRAKRAEQMKECYTKEE